MGSAFPGCYPGGHGIASGSDRHPLGEALSGAPVLFAVAVPFLAAFFLAPKKNWWALIPAWVMLCLTCVVLFEDQISGNVIGSFVLYSIALLFLVAFLLDRTHRWALIPFEVLAVIGIIPLLEDLVNGEGMGLVVMLLFAVPFFVVYFWSKKKWWALIPVGVFSSVAMVVLHTLI